MQRNPSSRRPPVQRMPQQARNVVQPPQRKKSTDPKKLKGERRPWGPGSLAGVRPEGETR